MIVDAYAPSWIDDCQYLVHTGPGESFIRH